VTIGPPLRANPGGQLTAGEIVGRTALVERLLDTLQLRSIVLTGERRLGKTTLTTLIEELAPARGWSLVKVSVEGLKTSDELYGVLIREIDRVGRSAVAKSARAAKDAVEGVKVAGVQLTPSAPVLDTVIRAAVERLDGRLLLVLDELPIFVRTADARSSGAGTDVLHALRRIRQDCGLRMLMLGSIGFHHATKDATGVLNDVDKEQLTALDRDDAIELALRLLSGEGLCDGDPLAVAAEIARQADCVPYYVHSIVEAAKRRPGRPPLLVEEVDGLVEAQLVPGDAWNMRHFRDRVPLYYGPDAALAIAALDAIAAAGDRAMSLDAIVTQLDLVRALAPVDRAAVQHVLTTLADDHYIVADAAGSRTFAFALVRRGWVITGR